MHGTSTLRVRVIPQEVREGASQYLTKKRGVFSPTTIDEPGTPQSSHTVVGDVVWWRGTVTMNSRQGDRMLQEENK